MEDRRLPSAIPLPENYVCPSCGRMFRGSDLDPFCPNDLAVGNQVKRKKKGD